MKGLWLQEDGDGIFGHVLGALASEVEGVGMLPCADGR